MTENKMNITTPPANTHNTFHSIEFLEAHAQEVVDFYYPKCIDQERGGYHQHFLANGSASESNSQRHLVSSCRLAINFAVSAQCFNRQDLRDAAQHGIQYLRESHRNSLTGGYAWTIENNIVTDNDNYCYGIAFVLMAYARAYSAGIQEAKAYMEETFELLESKFWRPEDQLYVDLIDADFQTVSPYRGQNSNMHCCEALISAYEASSDARYLDRAINVARRITVDMAAQCDGRIWEHYDTQWNVDYEYNRGDTSHKLRPWGFQPGHFTEWGKLLLIINRHMPQPWAVKRAIELFNAAMESGFDSEHGGLYYSISPSNTTCNDGKYSWVQAETIAAAALIALETQNNLYWCIYQQLWHYAITHMVDVDLKCWHRNLSHDNKINDTSGISMGRTDYHSIGACIEIIRWLRLTDRSTKPAALTPA